MTKEVTRTFDILDRMRNMFPRPDAICGMKKGEWYYYSTREYYEKSHQFALGLMAMGLNPGDKIATITTNRPEWNIADMGMAMTGIINVPMYPTIGEEEYTYILKHSEVKYVIAGDAKLFEKLKPVADKIPGLKEIFTFEDVPGARNYEVILKLGEENCDKYDKKLEQIKNSIKAEDLCTIIYTSGTTGVPKGVMLSHKNLASNYVVIAYMHLLGYKHRAVSFLPLCHVYERMMNYHYQYKGMGVYYVGNLGQILNALKEVKPHIFNSVPRLLEKLYNGFITKGKELTGIRKALYFWAIHLTRHFEYNKKYSPWLRVKLKIADKLVYSKWREAMGGNIVYAVSGGAALHPRISRLFGMAGMLNLEGYGLTETSPVIAVNYPLTKEMKIGTVGPVLQGIEVKLAEDGEILCRGDNVMMGYYKSPEQTAEVIDGDGWLHTGDIGTLEEGKYLKITDRKKEIFKLSGGKYIAPQMIENKLKTSNLIDQAMVIGENEKFASALISPDFVLLHDWCAANHIHFKSNKELIQFPEVISRIQKEVNVVNKTLGKHEEIKRFRLVSHEWSPTSGELSPSLKLRRNVIANKYKDIIAEIYSVQKN